MAVVDGNLRTTATRATPGIEQCEGVLRSLGGAPAADTTPPVVSNVTPATGGALAALDEWGCDVTDDDSGVEGVTIFRGGDGARRIEVIYETSIGACRGYTVTVTSISGGYRYRVRSEDGWPRIPTIYVKAVDGAGNEATVET